MKVSREEHAAGQPVTGEMNGRRFAESIGVAHGTVKRWLAEGLPCVRTRHQLWIDPGPAIAWIESRYGKSIAFHRRSVVYVAKREDGAVKIGWTSDIVRRLRETRKDERSDVELIACFPGDKPDELRLHARFADDRIEGEWFLPSRTILAFIDSLREAAA